MKPYSVSFITPPTLNRDISAHQPMRVSQNLDTDEISTALSAGLLDPDENDVKSYDGSPPTGNWPTFLVLLPIQPGVTEKKEKTIAVPCQGRREMPYCPSLGKEAQVTNTDDLASHKQKEQDQP